jgi:hypothetical protein
MMDRHIAIKFLDAMKELEKPYSTFSISWNRVYVYVNDIVICWGSLAKPVDLPEITVYTQDEPVTIVIRDIRNWGRVEGEADPVPTEILSPLVAILEQYFPMWRMAPSVDPNLTLVSISVAYDPPDGDQ